MAEIKQAKFIDKTGQEKDAVFIGAERAIFGDDGKRLDQKLDEMKEATGLVATDTKGVIGTAGAEVSLQALIDGVAKKVIDELVTNATLTQTLASYMTKSLMSSTQVNDANKVPTSALAYAMQQQIAQLNSKAFPYHGRINNIDVLTLSGNGIWYLGNGIINANDWSFLLRIDSTSGSGGIILMEIATTFDSLRIRRKQSGVSDFSVWKDLSFS